MDFTVLLAAVPAIEAMWTSVYLICAQKAFLIPMAILINFLSVLLFVKIIDRALLPQRIEKFLERRVSKKVKKIEKWFAKHGRWAILVLIALPSTGIGSFTGALIGRVFGLKGKILYLSVLAAIIISVLPAFLIAYGINVLGITC